MHEESAPARELSVSPVEFLTAPTRGLREDTPIKPPAPATDPGRIHIASLDGLRGMTALVVFGAHFEFFSDLSHVLWRSGGAVDFFFILSGFVIGRAYEARLGGGLGWRAYMTLRLKRLYPAMLAATILGAVVALARGEGLYPAMAMEAVLLPVLWGPEVFGGELFPLNGPQWSLFFELTVNALHAAVSPWLTDRRLAVVIGVAALWLALSALQFDGLSGGWTRESFWGGPPRAIFGFATGLMIFRLQRRGISAPAIPYPLVVGGLLLCLTRPLVPWEWQPAADVVVALLAMPAVMFLGVRSPTRGRVAAAARWAGRLSYPLYAIHMPLLRACEGIIGALPIGLGRVAWMVALPAVAGLAILFERTWDTPIRRWLKQGDRRAAVPA
jgi:peptidoglycan/LPS O-acetylase OafA/YrhL